MDDERHQPWYGPDATPPTPQDPKAREHLFDFRINGRSRRCALIDHGKHGVEAQFIGTRIRLRTLAAIRSEPQSRAVAARHGRSVGR